MTLEEYVSFCQSLPYSESSFPFDKTALVFKVCEKMFSLTSIDTFEIITVKALPEDVIDLCERYEGITPGYYMNKKHWISIETRGNIPDPMIKQLINNSYNLVVKSLPKKLQNEYFKNLI